MRTLSVCLILLATSPALAAGPLKLPTVEVLTPPAASGRLRLAVDGAPGWWWPEAKALEMLKALEAEQEYRLHLVPALESKVAIRDWQIAKLEEAAKGAEETFARYDAQQAKDVARVSSCQQALDRKRRSLGIGVLLGLLTASVLFGVAAAAF